MSTSYGKNYREEVADVNAGKVVPTGRDAVVNNNVGISGEGRQDVNIHDDGKEKSYAAMAEGLTKAAGDAAASYGRQRARDQWQTGYEDAGTAEGAARRAKEQPVWTEMIWGPDYEKQGAQARMLQDSVNTLELRMTAINESGKGETYTADEYKELLRAERDKLIDPIEDENFKDEVAINFGAASQRLIRDQASKHQLYTNMMNRTAGSNRIEQTVALATKDLQSGDPQRATDAVNNILGVVNDIRASTSLSAGNSLLTQQINVNLGNGSTVLYDALNEAGIIDELEPEQRDQVDDMWEVQQSNYNRKQITSLQSLRDLEEAGDPDGVNAGLELLEQTNPALYKQINGGGDMLRRAYQNERTNRAALIKKNESKINLSAGITTGTTQSQRNDIGSEIIMEHVSEGEMGYKQRAYEAAGVPFYPEEHSIPNKQLLAAAYQNPDWVGQWGNMNAGMPQGSNILQRMETFLNTPEMSDMTPEEFIQIHKTRDLMSAATGPFMYESLSAPEAKRMAIMRSEYGRPNSSMDDDDWMQHVQGKRVSQAERHTREVRNTVYNPTLKEKEEARMVLDMDLTEHYEGIFQWDSQNGVTGQDQADLLQELRDGDGDIKRAVAVVKSNIIGRSVQIGALVVSEGKAIQKNMPADTTLSGWLRGLDNDPQFRSEFSKAPYYADPGFSFLDGDARIRMIPGNVNQVLITLPNVNGGAPTPRLVNLPRSAADILPGFWKTVPRNTVNTIQNVMKGTFGDASGMHNK
jgi:hypothetical protein